MSVLYHDKIALGGGIVIKNVTTAEYNALTEEQKMLPIYYNITDDTSNETSVRFIEQTLTDSQKETARSNIGLDFETVPVTGTSTSGTCSLNVKRNSLTTVIKGTFTYTSNVNKGIGIAIDLNESLFLSNSHYRTVTLSGTNFFILWNGGQNKINIRPMLENVTSGTEISFQFQIDRVTL